ncbi:MAG: class I SAM-dependent methyltransferase, partial [Candidatus Thorarchaeota archaeon]|nr:class I SAM-dependent methyltransferase [Candidatus Thorarchaeota archaeon]
MSYQEIRDSLRINLLEFARTAFKILPPMDNPSILDIGCGSGIQTIELAKMCNGHITAIDIDVPALALLQR